MSGRMQLGIPELAAGGMGRVGERVGSGLVAGSTSSRPPELARVQRWRRAKETVLPELTLPWVPLEEALVQALPGYWLVPPPTEDLAPVRRMAPAEPGPRVTDDRYPLSPGAYASSRTGGAGC